MKTLLSTLFFLSFFISTSFTQTTVCYRVNASSDDAEELQNGNMNLTSTDLDLVEDASSSIVGQTVGMRFNNVAVPQAANIIDTYIQFKVDETNTSASSLTFRAQAADNPSTFTTANSNISSRATGLQSRLWNPVPAWDVIGDENFEQQSPNLSNLVQEVVNRSGWISGNSMVFIITGSGERTADSFNGGANNAPQVCITYEECGSIDTDNDNLPDLCDNCPQNANPGLDLDGVNDYVQKTNLNGLNTGNAVHTIEGWVYLDAYPPSTSWLMNLGQYNTGAHHWRVGSSGSTQFGYFGAGNVNLFFTLPEDEWTHIATTFDGTTYYLYINGELQGTDTGIFNFQNTNFNLGLRWSNERFFEGRIDEFRVWNTVRTQQQIQNNRFEELSGNETGLVAYYRLNEGEANGVNSSIASTATDKADNGNNATLNNFTKTGTSSNWTIGARVKHFDTDSDGLGDLCGDCDPNPNEDCMYFSNIAFWGKCIYDGDIVQLPCGTDTSFSALQNYFAYSLKSECTPCNACDEFEPPIVLKRGGSNAKPDDDAKSSASNVCYTIAISWEGCLLATDCAEFMELYPPFLTATLEIVDQEFPSFTVPAPVTVSCNQVNNLSLTGDVLDATDNCGILSVSYMDDIDVSDCNISSTTIVQRTWRVEDECNNVTTQIQNITVNPISCNGANLTITAIQSGIQDYYASVSIQSTSIIEAGADIGFYAAQSITLDDNFHARANSNFIASIQACSAANDNQIENRANLNDVNQDQLKINPNPFQDYATITYELVNDSEVNILLYNANGQLLRRLLAFTKHKSGIYQIDLERQHLSNGMYFIQLQTTKGTLTRRIIIQ